MDYTDQLVIQWAEYHRRRNAWIAHNFPQQAGQSGLEEATIGMIEEVGELAHAHLKKAQNIRGSEEQHVIAAKDAIGDCTVYLWGLTSQLPEMVDHAFWHSSNHYEMHPINNSNKRLLYLANAAGAIAWSVAVHTALDLQKKQCSRLVGHLRGYCREQEWNYDSIIANTWASVEERDWIKYPGTGRPVTVPDH